MSILYGRVFPPADVADPERVPGFLGVLGPEGPIGFSTNVTIEESGQAAGQPDRVVVKARGRAIDVNLTLAVERLTRNAMSMTQPGVGPALDFLQMGGEYTVSGKVGERALDFKARGRGGDIPPAVKDQHRSSGATRQRVATTIERRDRRARRDENAPHVGRPCRPIGLACRTTEKQAASEPTTACFSRRSACESPPLRGGVRRVRRSGALEACKAS